MLIPPNHTEDEVVAIIDRVVSKVAVKFKFGYHDLEDMKQQARLFALECLPRYDEKRPLENFIWVHVHNRLFNFKRDNYERPSRPCNGCPMFDKGLRSECKKYGDKIECDPFKYWFTRNSAKKNLMRPVELEVVCGEYESYHKNLVVDDVIMNEITDIINIHLPVSLRSDYIKMKYNLRIPKYKRLLVEEAVIAILNKHGYGDYYDSDD